jgi:DNA-directed RNA polymerase II subunit RPB7
MVFLCSGRHGFVVAITGVEDIGKGLIREGTGFVTFPVKYQCVVFRPFKGEILEAVVTMVNKVCLLSLSLSSLLLSTPYF